MVARKYNERLVAYESLRQMIGWLKLGASGEICQQPYAYNASSGRVLEKAGFVLEGRLRWSVIKAGQLADQFLYAKIRDKALKGDKR